MSSYGQGTLKLLKAVPKLSNSSASRISNESRACTVTTWELSLPFEKISHSAQSVSLEIS